jgi:2-polyprenyl-6-methoxyphenol hydroxylase-like FAD-dependent oxidoreductase
MRVLISGAGIAGLTVAYWLRRYGFTPTIVERAPSLLTGGYKIDVRGTALQVLRRMGIHDAVIAASTDMQGALLVDKDGKVVNKMSGDEFGHRVGEDLEIVRGTLCQILMDRISDAEFIFGDSIQAISQSSDRVRIEFTKNSPREFDLAIGADGLHSNVRRIVFGDESSFVRDLGLYLCVYTVPNYLNLDRLEMQYSELGRVAAIWSSRGDANAKACFGFAAPSVHINLRDRAQQQQVLTNVYAGIGWEIPRLLEMMPSAPDVYFDVAAQICMTHWSQGRVVLVGDAGYCASPMSGQGTSLALIGAYVLAGELAAASGAYQTAFHQYEKEMRPFVMLNQALGIQSANLMKSREKRSVFTWLLEQIMRIAPGRMIEFFINRSTRRIHQAANAIALKDYSA